MTVARSRQLNRAHFAFMRALLHGLDLRESWLRYLRPEGESADPRTIRSTVSWIRDEFAAAARREHRPGTARLVLIDAERLQEGEGAARPSLEEFAASRGLEDFSEAEQAEAYADAYPERGPASRRDRAARKARLITRQLEALRWLETSIAQAPDAEDGLEKWLSPVIATRLATASVRTPRELAARINAHGDRWWRNIPGIGRTKAARLVQWLQRGEAGLGLSLAPHVLTPRRMTGTDVLDAVVPRKLALVPIEKLLLPAHLDGSAAPNRGSAPSRAAYAHNDLSAIAAWLQHLHRGGTHSTGGRGATFRAYRKEAERFVLWSVLVCGKPLSAASREDFPKFLRFLVSPPSEWCGPRHHQRWSPDWRPLEGALGEPGMRRAASALRSMGLHMVSTGYWRCNVFEQAVQDVSRFLQESRPVAVHSTPADPSGQAM